MLSTVFALVSLVSFAGVSARPAPAQALTDANIIAIFDAANTYDIETGMLAEQKGSTKEVRAVGASLVRDHKAVRQQGRDLARKLGVTPVAPAVNPLAAQHAKALADLKGKTGAAFDLAFLDHEIAYHQAVIDAVTKTLLPAIQNAELKAFVEKIAPAFQAHLDMCKAAKAQIHAM
jgi:putative membrane protein